MGVNEQATGMPLMAFDADGTALRAWTGGQYVGPCNPGFAAADLATAWEVAESGAGGNHAYWWRGPIWPSFAGNPHATCDVAGGWKPAHGYDNKAHLKPKPGVTDRLDPRSNGAGRRTHQRIPLEFPSHQVPRDGRRRAQAPESLLEHRQI